jgi:Zn-dependent protease
MVPSPTLHAFAANLLGDSTAKDAKRLTLNPLAHIDVVGTLIVPALTRFLYGVALIGWARATPIRRDRIGPPNHRWLGFCLAATAGPLANLLL